jgi:hypothetical protein
MVTCVVSVLPQKFATAKLRVKVPLPETGMVDDAPVRVATVIPLEFTRVHE